MISSDALKTLNVALTNKITKTSSIKFDEIENEIQILSEDVAGLNTSFSASTNAFQSQITLLRKQVKELEPNDMSITHNIENGDFSKALSDFRTLTLKDTNELKLNQNKQNVNVEQLTKQVNLYEHDLRELLINIEQRVNNTLISLNNNEELSSLKNHISTLNSKNSNELSNLYLQLDSVKSEMIQLKSSISTLLNENLQNISMNEVLTKFQTKISSINDIKSRLSELTTEMSTIKLNIENITKDSGKIQEVISQNNIILSKYNELKSNITLYSALPSQIEHLTTSNYKQNDSINDLSFQFNSFSNKTDSLISDILVKVNNYKNGEANSKHNINISSLSTQEETNRNLISILETKINNLTNCDQTSYSVSQKLTDTLNNKIDTIKTTYNTDLTNMKNSLSELSTKFDQLDLANIQTQISSLKSSIRDTHSKDENEDSLKIDYNVTVKEENGKYMFQHGNDGIGASIQPGYNSISNKLDSKAVSFSSEHGSSFIFSNPIITTSLKSFGNLEGNNGKFSSLDVHGNIITQGSFNGLSQTVLGRGPLFTDTIQLDPDKISKIKSDDIINMVRISYSGWDIPQHLDLYTWRYNNGYVEIKCGNKIHSDLHQVSLY